MKVYVVCSYDSDNNNIESFVFAEKEKAQDKVRFLVNDCYEEDVKEKGTYAFGGYINYKDGTFLKIDLSEVELDV